VAPAESTGIASPPIVVAGDGPHYANNVALGGDGEYRLTFHFEPPSKAGFIRHVDKETGVAGLVAIAFPDVDVSFSEQTT